jgi:hypothetical protein
MMQEGALSPMKNFSYESNKVQDENRIASSENFHIKRIEETAFTQDCLQKWDFVKKGDLKKEFDLF